MIIDGVAVARFTDADRAWLGQRMRDPKLARVSPAARDLHRRVLWFLRATGSRDGHLPKSMLSWIAGLDGAVVDAAITGAVS
jgi:hypothetical protein